MTYMTLHRIGQYLVDPRWPRLAFTDETPRILDEPAAIDVDVDFDTTVILENYDLRRWAAGDSHAARAWRDAIKAHEATCHARACRRHARAEPEPRHSAIWAYHARAARARASGHAWEIRATIAAHDAAHDASR